MGHIWVPGCFLLWISLKPIPCWMVVWHMNFMTFHLLGMSSSQLTNSIIFQRGRYTTKQPCHGILTSSYAELLRIGWDVLQSMAWQWKWPRKSTNAMCNRDVLSFNVVLLWLLSLYYPWLPLLLFFFFYYIIMTIIVVISILKLIKWEKRNTYTTSERRSRCARRISKWAPSWCTASVPCFLGKVLINRKPKTNCGLKPDGKHEMIWGSFLAFQ